MQEYVHTLPAWVVDVLLEQTDDDVGDEAESRDPAADPFDDVPEHLRDL